MSGATSPDREELSGEATAALLEGLRGLVVALSEGKYKDASDDARLRVGDFNVKQALTCPTYAAQGSEPFQPTPRRMRRAVAAAALRSMTRTPDLDIVTAVRQTLRERSSLDEWVAEGLEQVGSAGRAVVAELAVEDIGARRRSLPWRPAPSDIEQRRHWQHPERALRLATDFHLQDRDPDGTTYHLLSRSPRPTHETAEVAYRATVATAAERRSPARIVVHYPDTGHAPRQVEVTTELLNEGAQVAALAVAVGLIQLGLRREDLDRRPGGQCHRCPVAEACGPGSEWRAGPGRLRGGLPPPP